MVKYLKNRMEKMQAIKIKLLKVLVVQWLKICLVMCKTQVRSVIRELRSHMPQSN